MTAAFFCSGTRARVRNQKSNRLRTEAQLLIAMIDHESPRRNIAFTRVKLGLFIQHLRVIFDHRKTNRRRVCINSAKPGFRAEVRLRNGHRIRCNQFILAGADIEHTHSAHIVNGDFAQAHL